MAPDLNSVPVSPRPSTTQPSTTSSRQTSHPASRHTSQIHPMSPPPLPLSPGSVHTHTHAFPPLSPSLPTSDTPMRHPRPMTAAEMHLELEKEQEAVVNRLTRELSALRAHSASVASTASSVDGLEGTRRERRGSSVSRSGIPMHGVAQSQSQSQSQRHSVSSQASQVERRGSIVSTPRYEEVAQQRAELEEVKRENEALKERIRELERLIRGEERGRSGAPSTTEG